MTDNKIQQIKEEAAKLKALIEADIKEYTGLNEFQYRMLIYNTGLDFLRTMEGNEGEYFKVLEGKKAFWNWWVGKWYSRDAAFLRERINDIKHLRSRYVEQEYKSWHNLKYLKEKTPLEASYYRLLDAILN